MGRVRWLLFVLSFFVSTALYAAVFVKDSAPESYTVKTGDTLWDIAGLYLAAPWQWPELWRHNTDIENPHLIYPGDQLRLVHDKEHGPQLTVERKPQLTLSPTGKKTLKVRPVPLVDTALIAPFLSRAIVMDEAALDEYPRVMGGYNEQILHADKDIIMTNSIGGASDDYVVLREQKALVDMNGNPLGVQMRQVSEAEIVSNESKNGALVRVVGNRYEVVQGDRLVPSAVLGESSLQSWPIEPAPASLRARVVDNFQDHEMMGKYDVVAIDVGDGEAKPGMLLGLYKGAPRIRKDNDKPEYISVGSAEPMSDEDIHRGPAIRIGEVLVFRTFANVSYGLIIEASDFVRRGTIVSQP